MDLKRELKEHFGKLGYHSRFPETVHFTPATSFVWQQLISKTKPQNEVEVYRKNIIINRLMKCPNVNDVLQFPIPEIEMFNKLNDARDRLNTLKMKIHSKREKANALRKMNQSNYLLVNSFKDNINNKQVNLHALNLKIDCIKSEIEYVHKLADNKALYVLPEQHSLAEDLVHESLVVLSQKIEKIVINNSNTKQNDLNYSSKHNTSNILPPYKENIKTCFSTIKKKTAQKSINKFASCTNLNATKFLKFEDCNEMDRTIINTSKTVHSTFLSESYDLLPESCFDFDVDDEFLSTHKSIDPFNSISKSESQAIQNQSKKYIFSEQNCYPEDVIEGIIRISECTNPRIIWSVFSSFHKNSLKNIKSEIDHLLDNLEGSLCYTPMIDKEDVVKLNFIYTKNNLLNLKNKKLIQKLKSVIEDKIKTYKFGQNARPFDTQINCNKWEAAIKFLQKEINDSKKFENFSEMKSMNLKISKIIKEMERKINIIEIYKTSKENLMDRIKKCQNNTHNCIRKFGEFIFDTEWFDTFLENIHSEEMVAFLEFPLNYNKKPHLIMENIFYKNIMKHAILNDSTTEDYLYIISALIENPQNTPEKILNEIIKKQEKLKIIKVISFLGLEDNNENCSLEYLKDQENYIEKASDALLCNIRSAKTHRILNSSSQMKQNMELWLEMPFKNCISKERDIDGKTYKEYEKMFENN